MRDLSQYNLPQYPKWEIKVTKMLWFHQHIKLILAPLLFPDFKLNLNSCLAVTFKRLKIPYLARRTQSTFFIFPKIKASEGCT